MISNFRSIPSLDGLRAFAVITVIIGHLHIVQLNHIYFNFIRNASFGVSGFFVLSGFLITGILLKEQDRTGKLDLSQFYIRRSFRIFPAFYVYLAVVAILGYLHLVSIDCISWVAAATYTWNYVLPVKSYVVTQTWSLSLEEQFYLVWPLVLLLSRKRLSLKIALWVIGLSPLSRLLTYALLPAYRGHINMMFHTHIDAILMGSVIALAQNLGMFKGLFEELMKPIWLTVTAVYFFFQLSLNRKLGGMFSLPIGLTLDALCWSSILIYITRFPKSPVGRVLNWKPVAHIGRISYSLYLWHPLFLDMGISSTSAKILLIIASAEASYWLVELPFLRLRDRLTSREAYASKAVPVSSSQLIES